MKTYKVNNLEITEEEVKILAVKAGLIKEEKPLNRLYKFMNKETYYVFTNECTAFR